MTKTADLLRRLARVIIADNREFVLVDPKGKSEVLLNAKIKLTLDPKTGKPGPKALILFGDNPNEEEGYFDHKALIPTQLLVMPEHLTNFEEHTSITAVPPGDKANLVEDALGEGYHNKKAGELLAKVKAALADPKYTSVKEHLQKMEQMFAEHPNLSVRSYE